VGVLEPRARIVGGLAVVLAAGTFALATVVGTDAFAGVPNVGVLLAVVALPGFLLGRTGVPDRIGPVVYEAGVAYVAGAVVATGFLLAGAYLLATTGGVGGAIRAFASTLGASWAPWGVAGYAIGLASTVVEAALGR